MSTEFDILKQILENKRKAPIRLIAKQLKIGDDYARYRCKELLKKGLVKKLKKKDWYGITSKGEKEMGERKKPIKIPSSKRYIPHKRVKEKAMRTKPKKRMKKLVRRKAIKRAKRIKVKIQKKKTKKAKEKISKAFLPKTQSEISISLLSREKIEGKEKTSRKKIQPPEKKFEKMIKIFKKIFRIKKD